MFLVFLYVLNYLVSFRKSHVQMHHHLALCIFYSDLCDEKLPESVIF